jgi:hypothetical protein
MTTATKATKGTTVINPLPPIPNPIPTIPTIPIPVTVPEIQNKAWSVTNAILFLIFLVSVFVAILTGFNVGNSVNNVKDSWGEYRCNPMFMPFASLFGYNAKDNFSFCMGEVFKTHSEPYVKSSTSMFSGFTGVLGSMLDSTNSLRNTMATLGGGINTIVHEFTERISMFFFRLQVSAITIKSLIGRMYAIMFSVMYMGLSGISGMTSFTNTFLFSFLDTFCFPGDTEILLEKGMTKIKDIKIGDIIADSTVTSIFKLCGKGQPMVKLGNIIVSTNHYVLHEGKYIMARYHPDSVKINETYDELYCLNTDNNRIRIGDYTFMDYDETTTADKDTMNYIEGRINATNTTKTYDFTEYRPAIDENTIVKTMDGPKMAKDIKLGDKLTTGSEIVGLIRPVVKETSILQNVKLTPSTLYWDENSWKRVGTPIKEKCEMVSFIATPNSQIELENVRIRDYMELCSPDSEIYYSKSIK